MKTPEQLKAEPKLGRVENVVRYIGGSDFDRGTNKINGSAFERKSKDRDGVSLTRTGILSDDLAVEEKMIRDIFSSRMTLGKTAIFAELNVGSALDVLAEFDEDLFFCQDALAAKGKELANPALALIVGLPLIGEAIGSLKSEVAGDRLQGVAHWKFDAVPMVAD